MCAHNLMWLALELTTDWMMATRALPVLTAVLVVSVQILSSELAGRMHGGVSFEQFHAPFLKCETEHNCPLCCDDAVSHFVHSKEDKDAGMVGGGVPEAEWLEAHECQVHNGPVVRHAPHGMWRCRSESGRPDDHSNRTVALHRIKQDKGQLEMYSGLRPFIEAMRRDCEAEWGPYPAGDGTAPIDAGWAVPSDSGGDGGGGRAVLGTSPLRVFADEPGPQCARWDPSPAWLA